MKAEIRKIKVAARIRKQSVKIEELAADIKKNGLLNPVTVLAVDGGEFQLIAGLRRIKAAQALGWTEIDVNVVSPADAEAALRMEISENEQREPFTFSEKMDYARLIEEIEREKARQRMSYGGKKRPHDTDSIGPKGKSRDAIGGKIDMSGKQYDRARYIAEHAPQSVIDELDSGKRTIRGAYDDLRDAAKKRENSGNPITPNSESDRAIRTERELDALKDRHLKEIMRREGTIDKLKLRIAGLEKELTGAKARIQELEKRYE